MPNRYYLCSRLRPPVEFDISNESPAADAEIAYFVRIFQALERSHGLDGYTVCFAWGSRLMLPRLGPDVIAVIYGDEHCRVPAYVNAVAAVIKCHGFFPNFVPRRGPLRLAQIEAAEFLRNLVLWVPTGARWVLSRRARDRCHLVPVGYGRTTDVEALPFDRRPHLISFLGSIGDPAATGMLRRLVGTPKAYSRKALLRTLRHLQERYGIDQIRLQVTESFQASLQTGGASYFEVLAGTKICVAPRGTAHETLRVCEGLRFGCVVIADRLPPHPFYRNSPVIQIDDWRELPDLLDDLLADEQKLAELQQHGLRYWHDVLAEPAVASRCADALGLAGCAP